LKNPQSAGIPLQSQLHSSGQVPFLRSEKRRRNQRSELRPSSLPCQHNAGKSFVFASTRQTRILDTETAQDYDFSEANASILSEHEYASQTQILHTEAAQDCHSSEATISILTERGYASETRILDIETSQDCNFSEAYASILTEHRSGELARWVAAVGGVSLYLACALQFSEAPMGTATIPAAGTEVGFPPVMTWAGAEPSNALSLPTWVIHVASVVE
jgi:hypothetical protein